MCMLVAGRGAHCPRPQGAHSLAGAADIPAHVDRIPGPAWGDWSGQDLPARRAHVYSVQAKAPGGALPVDRGSPGSWLGFQHWLRLCGISGVPSHAEACVMGEIRAL